MKVCLVASAGGHLEQIKQLKQIMEQNDCFFVVNRTYATEKLQQKKYLVHDLQRKNKLLMLLSIVRMFFEQFYIFLKERPDAVVTTGAAVAIPMCLICKILHRKTVYIESFARINSTNKTGRFLYKYVDLFIVQWKELLKFYPKAVYGGWIY